MARKAEDPTQAIRRKAGSYAGVDEGTACTQSSFKTGAKAFLFIGEQGGRYKAMFKLAASRDEARRRAEKEPDRFQVGSGPWVTARFTADAPLPEALWTKWLDESYALSVGPSEKKASKKKTRKKKTG
jgi:hypothetical protein